MPICVVTSKSSAAIVPGCDFARPGAQLGIGKRMATPKQGIQVCVTHCRVVQLRCQRD
jgi:hypothetical protein